MLVFLFLQTIKETLLVDICAVEVFDQCVVTVLRNPQFTAVVYDVSNLEKVRVHHFVLS